MYQPHAAVFDKVLWAKLRGLAPLRSRPARSVLLRQGDPGTHVLLLESGSAIVTLTGENGERTLLAVREAGELLGELAVLDAQPRTASVIAAETCQVRVIPAPEFLGFVDEHRLTASILRHAIARVREAEAVRLELATAPVPARLASALGRLVRSASCTADNVHVRLTQVELSQLIGASRNAVGTAIKAWRDHGWLETESGGGLLIRDIARIKTHSLGRG